jgi:hypothetical protein
MVGKDQLQNRLSQAGDLVGLGRDDHSFFDLARARSMHPVFALDLHDAEPAGSDRLETGIVTQTRNVDTDFQSGLENCLTFRNRDLAFVDGQVDRLLDRLD